MASSPVPVFTGRVNSDGVLTLDDRPEFLVFLKTLAETPVEITVKKKRSQRSNDQNRWWWGVAIPVIAEHCGYDHHDRERLHYALVSKCFGTTTDAAGLEIPNARSSQLTTDQFSELMEWVVRFAAMELGVDIPLPSETTFADEAVR